MTGHDGIDLKTAQAEVRWLTGELAASGHELDALAYAVSHDLRAPLRAIDEFGQLLADDCGDALDETGKDYLHRIRAAATRMGGLIDDLLALSKVTRVELHRTRVDLGRLAAEVVAGLRAAEPAREVTVSIADPLVAMGDPWLLRLVLQNLIGNAWKFTGGRPQGHIQLGSAERDGVPFVFVHDDGAGFEPRDAEKIFAPFQCARTTNNGTGIGLAVVWRIVHRHGGQVWAEGEPGHGATFSFTLDPAEGRPR
jgi:signal transduction histidine kinase